MTRTVEPSIPPRVDYELTSLGRTLLEPVLALAAWSRENIAAIEKARQAYDAKLRASAIRTGSPSYKNAEEDRPTS